MCGFNAIFYIVGSFYCVLQINIMSHLQTIRVVHNCILGVVPQLESNLATNGVPRCASLSLSLYLYLEKRKDLTPLLSPKCMLSRIFGSFTVLRSIVLIVESLQ